MAIPNLEIEEFQYGDTGILLNGTSTLPFVDIESIEGLDSVELRVQSHNHEGVDGGYVYALYETIRTVTLEGKVYSNPLDVETYLDQLKFNFAPTEFNQPLYFRTDIGTRLVFGKSLGIKYPKNQERRLGIVSFQLQISCEDPRIYDVNEISVTASRTAGSLNASLGGNRTSPAILTIAGPIDSPSITHSVTGTSFSFPGYSLPSGQTITINLGNRAVLLNGSTNLRSSMIITGNWYLLTPGSNTFTFGGSGHTASTTLNVATRSAWR